MLQNTLLLTTILSFLTAAQSTSDACIDLMSTLSLENTTILAAERITGGETISTPGSCQSKAFVTTDACRVYAYVNTTASSAVHFEMWLPDVWFGRFLAVGNGGLGGCIHYSSLDYGTTLHFATIGSDSGHDGFSGAAFLNQPEVINDFAFRAIHVQTVLGKQIVNAYYNRPHDKSYFIGCSTGGRQGLHSASLYPDDFDGIVSGAPTTDFNHLAGWTGMLGRFIGAPNPSTNKSFIPASLWPIISEEIRSQCDELDGVKDGIITEPDDCAFDPKALLCDASSDEPHPPRRNFNADDEQEAVTNEDLDQSFDDCRMEDINFAEMTNPRRNPLWFRNDSEFQDDVGKANPINAHGQRDQVFLGDASPSTADTSRCLTAPQVDALTQIYQPLLGTSGQLLYPRFDPGAEAYGNFRAALSGTVFPIVEDWFRFAIYNDSNHMFDNFGVEDIEFADTINPGGISTWNGDFSAFHDRGGKIVAYHGRGDELIASGNSKRLYQLISSTAQRSIDDFYRLFLIPGLNHCINGPGAWAIGQIGVASNAVNDSAHNIILSLVDWVEKGQAPDVIVGTTPLKDLKSGAAQEKRVHCRYPQRSVFNGTDFVCED